MMNNAANYTILKLDDLKPNQSSNSVKNKIIFIFSLLFFLSNFLFFIYTTFFLKENKTTDLSARALQNGPTPQILIGFPYEKIDDIPFIVNRIEGINTHGTDYFDYLKKINPQIDRENLIKQINREIFTFYVLNRKVNNKIQYPTNYEKLLRKNQELKEQYNQNLIRYTGYYLKIRFRGYYGKREEEIKKYFGEKNLEDLTKEKINQLMAKYSNPALIYPNLNNDEEISQLNNKEKAIVYFENETFEDPPFDDPMFYQYLSQTPLNQYSQVFPLKTTNPFQKEKETYAYLVFFIKEKTGNNLPINYLIYQALNEKNYR